MSYFDWKAASEEFADDEKKLENMEDIVVNLPYLINFFYSYTFFEVKHNYPFSVNRNVDSDTTLKSVVTL